VCGGVPAKLTLIDKRWRGFDETGEIGRKTDSLGASFQARTTRERKMTDFLMSRRGSGKVQSAAEVVTAVVLAFLSTKKTANVLSACRGGDYVLEPTILISTLKSEYCLLNENLETDSPINIPH
jgi:hypothetical protein